MTVSAADVPAVDAAQPHDDYRSALLASFLGWTLDAFDFFVLVFVLPSVAEEFHTDVPAVARCSSASWRIATGGGCRS